MQETSQTGAPLLYFELRQRTSRLLLLLTGASVLLFGAVDDIVLTSVELTIFGVALGWALRRINMLYTPVWTALYIPFALVIAAGSIQLLLGGSELPVATSDSIALWITYLLFFALIFHCLIDGWVRRESMRWMATGGGLLGVIALVQTIWKPGSALGLRPAPGGDPLGPLAQAEHLTVVFELLLPLALLAAMEGGRRAWKWHLSAAGIVLGAVLGGSLIGLCLIGIELAVFGVIWLYDLRRSFKSGFLKALGRLSGFAFSASILLAGALAIHTGPKGWTLADSMPLRDGDVRAAAENMFLAKPLTGHGLGAFGAAFEQFSPPDERNRLAHLESDPMEMALELGVPGAACQALFAGLALLSTLGLSRRAWLGALLPLSAAWIHSWTSFPFAVPGVAFVALLVLARIPAEGVPRTRKRRRIDGSPVGSPRGAPIY